MSTSARQHVSKRYGKSARRSSTFTTSPLPSTPGHLASSSDMDSDSEVVSTLLLDAPTIIAQSKGKGKEIESITSFASASAAVSRRRAGGSSARSSNKRVDSETPQNERDEVESMDQKMEEDVDPRKVISRKPSMLNAMKGRRKKGNESPSVSPLKNEVFASTSTFTLKSPPAPDLMNDSSPLGDTRKRSLVEVVPESSTIDVPESPIRRKRGKMLTLDKSTIDATIRCATSSITSPVLLASIPTPSILQSPPRHKSTNLPSAPSTPKRLSPAKDLTSVFDMFQDSAPVVATDSAKKGNGMIAMLGSRNTNTSPFASPQSNRKLQRSSSAPDIGTPPPPDSPRRSAMPNSPSRQNLGATTSLPSLLSPSAYPMKPHSNSNQASRESSPTKAPSRMINRAGTAGGGLGGVGGGGRKTYGGARSFKRDDEEERLFGLNPPPPAPPMTIKGVSNPRSEGASKSSPFTATSRKLLPALPRPAERDTYSSLRRRWGADSDEEMEESQKDITSDLKSITQLRARGENTRFVDEFNYLVEGLGKGMAVGVRRASAIEVLRKILDSEFVRRLKASGFVERVYLEFRKAEAGEGDRILDPCLAFLLATLSRDQRIAEPLLRVSPTVDVGVVVDEDAVFEEPICEVLVILCEMTERSWATEEIGGQMNIKGLSKIEVRTLTTVRDIIDKSGLIDDATLPITLRSLSLIAISIVASFTPRSIFQPHRLICNSGTLDIVIKAFIQDTQSLDGRIGRFENGLDLLPSDHSISLSLIDTSLRVIEVCLSADPTASYILFSHLSSFTMALSSLLHFCSIILRNELLQVDVDVDATTKKNQAAMDCLACSLRMLGELTIADPAWSIGFVETKYGVATLVNLIGIARIIPRVEELDGEEENGEEDAGKKMAKTNKTDILCLALGVLTNLVETVERTRDILREIKISSNCAGTRNCARECRCVDRTTAIHRLADLYLAPLDDSDDSVESSFINGYSGILLGLIMLDSLPNQLIISKELEKDQEAMEKLLEAMTEFADLHEAASKETYRLANPEQGEDGEETLGGRSDVADRIRKMLISFE